MAREPFRAMFNSVWDCFWNPWPGESLREMSCNAVLVVTCWWKGQ